MAPGAALESHGPSFVPGPYIVTARQVSGLARSSTREQQKSNVLAQPWFKFIILKLVQLPFFETDVHIPFGYPLGPFHSVKEVWQSGSEKVSTCDADAMEIKRRPCIARLAAFGMHLIALTFQMADELYEFAPPSHGHGIEGYEPVCCAHDV